MGASLWCNHCFPVASASCHLVDMLFIMTVVVDVVVVIMLRVVVEVVICGDIEWLVMKVVVEQSQMLMIADKGEGVRRRMMMTL